MGFSVARPLIDDLRSPTPALGRILVVENSYSDRKRENSYLFPAFDRAENNFISSFNSPFLSLSLCNKYSNVVFVRWRAIHKVVKTIINKFQRYFLSPLPAEIPMHRYVASA